MIRIFSLGLLGLWLPVATPPASAENVTVSVRVPTSDLDLGNPQGVRRLRHRIVAAARHVCRDADDDYAFMLSARNRCRRDAIADAEPQMRYAIELARQRAQPQDIRLASR